MSPRRRTPKDILQIAKQVAVQRGGRCVTRKITSSEDRITLVCARGHRWDARPHDVIGQRGSWCKICGAAERAASQRVGLPTVQRYAKQNGGRCLAKTYINAKQKLDFVCAEGHHWEATWSNLARGQWCPTCRRAEAAAARRLGIGAAQAIARKRRGKCLSGDYVHNRSSLRWQCKKGHEWSASLDSVKGGSWCPECARLQLSRKRKGRAPPERRKITLRDLRDHARKHRGRCRTDHYVNQRQVIDWECKRGHRFRSSWANTLGRENFCPTCTQDDRKQEMLKRARQHARANKGKCLSRSYEEARAPMRWECKAGHKFSDTWFNVTTRENFCTRCAS